MKVGLIGGSNLTFAEKMNIAATARKLICLLQMCDDDEFADEVLTCIRDGDDTAILPEFL